MGRAYSQPGDERQVKGKGTNAGASAFSPAVHKRSFPMRFTPALAAFSLLALAACSSPNDDQREPTGDVPEGQGAGMAGGVGDGGAASPSASVNQAPGNPAGAGAYPATGSPTPAAQSSDAPTARGSGGDSAGTPGESGSGPPTELAPRRTGGRSRTRPPTTGLPVWCLQRRSYSGLHLAITFANTPQYCRIADDPPQGPRRHPHAPSPRWRPPGHTLPDFDPVPRKYRHDGWTPERQKAFIAALADTGSVSAPRARST